MQEILKICRNKWSILVGSLEINETIFVAGKIESFEETGYKIDLIEKLDIR